MTAWRSEYPNETSFDDPRKYGDALFFRPRPVALSVASATSSSGLTSLQPLACQSSQCPDVARATTSWSDVPVRCRLPDARPLPEPSKWGGSANLDFLSTVVRSDPNVSDGTLCEPRSPSAPQWKQNPLDPYPLWIGGKTHTQSPPPHGPGFHGATTSSSDLTSLLPSADQSDQGLDVDSKFIWGLGFLIRLFIWTIF